EFAGQNSGLACLCCNFLGQHPNDPNILYTGLQDNGTARTSGGPMWTHICGGDGGYCAVNWANPDLVLVFANGTVYRSTTGRRRPGRRGSAAGGARGGRAGAGARRRGPVAGAARGAARGGGAVGAGGGVHGRLGGGGPGEAPHRGPGRSCPRRATRTARPTRT